MQFLWMLDKNLRIVETRRLAVENKAYAFEMQDSVQNIPEEAKNRVFRWSAWVQIENSALTI